MDTKTCKKCGWVVALRDPLNKCPVCGEFFEDRVCSICGKPFKMWAKKTICRDCYKERYDWNAYHDTQTNRRRAIWDEWIKKVKQVPTDYPRLTEAQWLEVVSHFDGCAMCGNESVDTRGYFVPYESGGRYCDWNVIPLCSECATRVKSPNWFMQRKRPKGLTEIISYLEVRLNNATKKS